MLIMGLFPYNGLCDDAVVFRPDTVPGRNGHYMHREMKNVYGGFRCCNVYEYATHGIVDTNRRTLIATLKFNEKGNIYERTEYTDVRDYAGRTNYFYNNNGKLKESIHYRLPYKIKYCYLYDSLERKIQELRISKDEDSSITKYYYKNDEKGNQVEYGFYYREDSAIFYKRTSSYDENGVKIKDSAWISGIFIDIDYYENGQIYYSVTMDCDSIPKFISDYRYYYEDKGHRLKRIRRDSSYKIDLIILTEFDDSLRKIQQTETDSLGNILNSRHYNYDDDGRLISEKYFEDKTDSLAFVNCKNFFYDDKDRVIHEKRSDLKSPFNFDINKEYDSLDNCVEESTTIENTSIIYSGSTDYKYDSSGNILEKNQISTGSLDDYTLYEYNSDGKITSKKYYDFHNIFDLYYLDSLSLREETVYIYNEQGLLTEKYKKDTANLIWKYKYTYDSLGNMTSKDYTHNNFHRLDSNFYINNSLSESIRYYSSSNDSKYIYNEQGQIIEEGEIKDGVYTRNETNDYDEKGRLIKNVHYFNTTISMTEYFYDDKGNKLKEVHQGPHIPFDNFTTFFKYDQYGNMIEEYTVYKNHLSYSDKKVIYEFTRQ